MDHPAPAPEVEPPAHHPASPGGQQQPPPHTIPNILLGDLTGTAYGSVVLTSTQRGVWGRVVGGLQEADREELRKACKTTAAVERVLASLPRWIEVVPPQEEEESDEGEGSKDEDEDVEPEEEDEGDEEDEDEEVDAAGPTPGANPQCVERASLRVWRMRWRRSSGSAPGSARGGRRVGSRSGSGSGAHETGFQVQAANDDEDEDDEAEDDLVLESSEGGTFAGCTWRGAGGAGCASRRQRCARFTGRKV